VGLSRRNSSIVDGEPAVGSMCSSIIALGLTRGHLYTPERPHSGAQLTFTDHKGFRFQVFITDQDDPRPGPTRGHARVEDPSAGGELGEGKPA